MRTADFSKTFLITITTLVFLYFSYLMLLITKQYFLFNTEVYFLELKNNSIKSNFYLTAFFTHIYTSFIVLIFGFIQFFKSIRLKFSTFHKKIGKVYVFLILFFSAPTGFVMALFANGGLISKIAFVLQSIIWFYFTFKAYRYASQKKWYLHKNFMLRSYALTLSAISLRLFKWLIVSVFELPSMDTYRLVAWLGWIVNIIIVELYIINRKKFRFN